MKINMWMRGIAAMAIANLWAGAALAESTSQAYYRQCLAQASSAYTQCGRMNSSWGQCQHEQHHDKAQCWASFTQMGQNDPYYAGQAPRFEPVPIPQRRAYILPGMR